MEKDETTEAQVLRRYIELAGLVKDGQMVNKDKESRAREYVKLHTRIVEQISERNQIQENSKYGELIVQANDVQYYLIKLILLRSFDPSRKFEEDLERLQLGQLIGYLNVCAQSKLDLDLIGNLKNYKDKRDALAHKMFTAKKLTPSACKNAIKSGDKIIKYLVESLKKKQRYMIKGSDKISDLPTHFNKLVDLVKSLEKRIEKLERPKKALRRKTLQS